ncbi:MAG: hypothetical protein KAU90_08325 [Sulfurovaceae bacterium]|nr:hypothetical protein [Sulfurovaceae bacterium]
MFSEMDKIVKEYFNRIDNLNIKNIGDIDKGFLESCIEQDMTGLGIKFLQNIYHMAYEEALSYMVNLKVELLRRSKDEK